MRPFATRSRRPLAAAVAALVVVSSAVLAPATASAQPAPRWSGLDTRQWDRPIPA
ncbi:alpha/beta hydrolase, partial [Dietzia cercidiphylli]|nr:alpha/beta hydrolase [Dietzia cercidiphylli]